MLRWFYSCVIKHQHVTTTTYTLCLCVFCLKAIWKIVLSSDIVRCDILTLTHFSRFQLQTFGAMTFLTNTANVLQTALLFKNATRWRHMPWKTEFKLKHFLCVSLVSSHGKVVRNINFWFHFWMFGLWSFWPINKTLSVPKFVYVMKIKPSIVKRKSFVDWIWTVLTRRVFEDVNGLSEAV